ncbi:unnamed protein product [Amoebophrya sp. A25]|nr:unnamed protein product [Amoebophrya sp. A25]|eukprot:GSA25T00016320001.1
MTKDEAETPAERLGHEHGAAAAATTTEEAEAAAANVVAAKPRKGAEAARAGSGEQTTEAAAAGMIDEAERVAAEPKEEAEAAAVTTGEAAETAAERLGQGAGRIPAEKLREEAEAVAAESGSGDRDRAAQGSSTEGAAEQAKEDAAAEQKALSAATAAASPTAAAVSYGEMTQERAASGGQAQPTDREGRTVSEIAFGGGDNANKEKAGEEATKRLEQLKEEAKEITTKIEECAARIEELRKEYKDEVMQVAMAARSKREADEWLLNKGGPKAKEQFAFLSGALEIEDKPIPKKIIGEARKDFSPGGDKDKCSELRREAVACAGEESPLLAVFDSCVKAQAALIDNVDVVANLAWAFSGAYEKRKKTEEQARKDLEAKVKEIEAKTRAMNRLRLDLKQMRGEDAVPLAQATAAQGGSEMLSSPDLPGGISELSLKLLGVESTKNIADADTLSGTKCSDLEKMAQDDVNDDAIVVHVRAACSELSAGVEAVKLLQTEVTSAIKNFVSGPVKEKLVELQRLETMITETGKALETDTPGAKSLGAVLGGGLPLQLSDNGEKTMVRGSDLFSVSASALVTEAKKHADACVKFVRAMRAGSSDCTALSETATRVEELREALADVVAKEFVKDAKGKKFQLLSMEQKYDAALMGRIREAKSKREVKNLLANLDGENQTLKTFYEGQVLRAKNVDSLFTQFRPEQCDVGVLDSVSNVAAHVVEGKPVATWCDDFRKKFDDVKQKVVAFMDAEKRRAAEAKEKTDKIEEFINGAARDSMRELKRLVEMINDLRAKAKTVADTPRDQGVTAAFKEALEKLDKARAKFDAAAPAALQGIGASTKVRKRSRAQANVQWVIQHLEVDAAKECHQNSYKMLKKDAETVCGDLSDEPGWDEWEDTMKKLREEAESIENMGNELQKDLGAAETARKKAEAAEQKALRKIAEDAENAARSAREVERVCAGLGQWVEWVTRFATDIEDTRDKLLRDSAPLGEAFISDYTAFGSKQGLRLRTVSGDRQLRKGKVLGSAAASDIKSAQECANACVEKVDELSALLPGDAQSTANARKEQAVSLLQQTSNLRTLQEDLGAELRNKQIKAKGDGERLRAEAEILREAIPGHLEAMQKLDSAKKAKGELAPLLLGGDFTDIPKKLLGTPTTSEESTSSSNAGRIAAGSEDNMTFGDAVKIAPELKKRLAAYFEVVGAVAVITSAQAAANRCSVFHKNADKDGWHSVAASVQCESLGEELKKVQDDLAPFANELKADEEKMRNIQDRLTVFEQECPLTNSLCSAPENASIVKELRDTREEVQRADVAAEHASTEAEALSRSGRYDLGSLSPDQAHALWALRDKWARLMDDAGPAITSAEDLVQRGSSKWKGVISLRDASTLADLPRAFQVLWQGLAKALLDEMTEMCVFSEITSTRGFFQMGYLLTTQRTRCAAFLDLPKPASVYGRLPRPKNATDCTVVMNNSASLMVAVLLHRSNSLLISTA